VHPALNQANPCRFKAPAALDYIDVLSVTFLERRESGSRWGDYLASGHWRDRAAYRHDGTTELIMLQFRRDGPI